MFNNYRNYPYQNYQSSLSRGDISKSPIPSVPKPIPPTCKPAQKPKPAPAPPCPPKKKPKPPPKKKLDFKALKKDTCKSLNDVECFLNNFSNTLKYIRLINLLK